MTAQPLRIAMIGPFGLGPKATVRERALPLARAMAAAGHRVTIAMPPGTRPRRPAAHGMRTACGSSTSGWGRACR